MNGFAYALIRNGDVTEARQQIAQAEKWSRTDAERRQTKSLSNYLANIDRLGIIADSAGVEIRGGIEKSVARSLLQIEPPGQILGRVSGDAASVECDDTGGHLTVIVSQREMVFDVPDPAKVLVRHTGVTGFALTCGPQKGIPVTVEYLAYEASGSSVGLLKTLEY